MAAPVLFAPVGVQTLAHPDGDRHMVRTLLAELEITLTMHFAPDNPTETAAWRRVTKALMCSG